MARVKFIGIRETLPSSLPKAEFERLVHEGGAVRRWRNELSKPGVAGTTTENVEWVDLDFPPILCAGMSIPMQKTTQLHVTY